MRRFFLLARSKAPAFAGVEVSLAVLVVVMSGLLLPALQKEDAKAAPGRDAAPAQPGPAAQDGQDQAGTAPAGDPGGIPQPVTADGSVRKIKFDVNADPFRRRAKAPPGLPPGDDY